MYRKCNDNDLQEILSQAIEQMLLESPPGTGAAELNLAELSRRTGISRSRLRTLKTKGFIIRPHGNSGRKAIATKLSGYTGVVDDELRKNNGNSEVIYERIRELGYVGGKTQLKQYIHDHRDLMPPARLSVMPQGNRGRRYTTDPGESYQMDWGFTRVDANDGNSYRVACFAMICHHCGTSYIEFFPNAKQENLFIGMIHAFQYMGIPQNVLTDNMKSVVIERDIDGHPIWQKDYEAFMNLIGFHTKLCKPRHPYTKGKVERLIQFVKSNFLAGMTFSNVTELNYEAVRWCDRKGGIYHRAVDGVPHILHRDECLLHAGQLVQDKELAMYLCPPRSISFDGFVNYEGRRFGVPLWYKKKVCRISRKEYTVTIYDEDLSRVLTQHDVTWSRRDSFCRDQYIKEQPEEFPTAPVKTTIRQLDQSLPPDAFRKFSFGEGLWDE